MPRRCKSPSDEEREKLRVYFCKVSCAEQNKSREYNEKVTGRLLQEFTLSSSRGKKSMDSADLTDNIVSPASH